VSGGENIFGEAENILTILKFKIFKNYKVLF